jgi:CBS domain-containing protein
MPQNIRDVMTSNPCTIDAEKSVAYAAKMMLEEDVGLAPIVEGDKLIGMLTDRDIATRVAAEGRDPDQVKVRDVASTQLFSIDPTQDLDEALRMMAKHQVRRLPVVEADGRLVGVVAQADIAREASDTQTGQLVEEISESGGQMSSIEEGQFPTQFPRPIDDQPESSLIGEEPQVEAQQEEEGVSKVQAASSRGRRKRSTTKRKTAARKSTGTRKRKTASRKRSTAKRSTTKKRSTAKKRTTAKRSTAKRRSTTKKRSTAKKRGTTKKRSTAKRKTAGRKAAATRKRKTATRKTAGRKAAGTRKRKTGGRKSATRKTAGRKAAGTRKRKTATRKTAGRKAASTRKRKTTTRKRSTAKRSTAKRRSTTRRRTSR